MNQKIAEMTGIPLATVERIDQAHTDLLFALGLAHPDDEVRGPALRKKYPDLLRDSVVSEAGRSETKPLTHELEATIAQLESGATAREVVQFMTAYYELNGLVDHEHTMAYRAWAEEWTKGSK